MSAHLCDHEHMMQMTAAWSWGLPLSIFTASLLGSLHCAGMCTGLMSAMTSGARARWTFHSGRAVSYVGLGAIAGGLGAGVPRLPAGFGFAAVFLYSVALVVLGLKAFNSVHLAWPAPVARRFSAFYARVVKPGSRGVLVPFAGGFFLPLLPCGWLYAFILGAASTGSAVRGAISLAAFFAGTLPALEMSSSLFTGVLRAWLQPVARRVPWLPGTILVSAGFFSLFLKFF